MGRLETARNVIAKRPSSRQKKGLAGARKQLPDRSKGTKKKRLPSRKRRGKPSYPPLAKRRIQGLNRAEAGAVVGRKEKYLRLGKRKGDRKACGAKVIQTETAPVMETGEKKHFFGSSKGGKKGPKRKRWRRSKPKKENHVQGTRFKG